MSDDARYLVVDVGGTNLKYALMDRSGTMIQKKSGRNATRLFG